MGVFLSGGGVGSSKAGVLFSGCLRKTHLYWKMQWCIEVFVGGGALAKREDFPSGC